MSDRTAIEFALRSLAIDVLDMAERLGLGPVTLFADPRQGGYIDLIAFEPDGTTQCVYYSKAALEVKE